MRQTLCLNSILVAVVSFSGILTGVLSAVETTSRHGNEYSSWNLKPFLGYTTVTRPSPIELFRVIELLNEGVGRRQDNIIELDSDERELFEHFIQLHVSERI